MQIQNELTALNFHIFMNKKSNVKIYNIVVIIFIKNQLPFHHKKLLKKPKINYYENHSSHL